MKLILFTLLFFAHMSTAQTPSIHDYSFININGETVSLSTFKGKKLLLVNVASECGYTGQYKELQALHEQYGDQLIIIGFPCDQFGGQEPGTEEEIKQFCEKNYGVTFLMASKIDVKGDGQHPIYAWLTSKKQNGVEDSTVQWNFNKYLIDEEGHYLHYFPSAVNPLDEKISSLLN